MDDNERTKLTEELKDLQIGLEDFKIPYKLILYCICSESKILRDIYKCTGTENRKDEVKEAIEYLKMHKFITEEKLQFQKDRIKYHATEEGKKECAKYFPDLLSGNKLRKAGKEEMERKKKEN